MKRRLVTVMGIGIALGATSLAADTQFSAETVQSTAQGQQTTGNIFVGDKRVRTEGSQNGEQYVQIRETMPWLNVFGGCCGSDFRHIAAIANRQADIILAATEGTPVDRDAGRCPDDWAQDAAKQPARIVCRVAFRSETVKPVRFLRIDDQARRREL